MILGVAAARLSEMLFAPTAHENLCPMRMAADEENKKKLDM
jgi:hypothetical protein